MGVGEVSGIRPCAIFTLMAFDEVFFVGDSMFDHAGAQCSSCRSNWIKVSCDAQRVASDRLFQRMFLVFFFKNRIVVKRVLLKGRDSCT